MRLQDLPTGLQPLLDPAVLAIVTAASIGLALVSLILLPLALARLPVDWLARPAPSLDAERARSRRQPLRTALRNLAAALLILAGVAMLVLPGQGLLTIVIGVFVSDLPGRARALRWLLLRPGVLPLIDTLRRRAGKPPLLRPARQEAQKLA